jgi:hypothetical protein
MHLAHRANNCVAVPLTFDVQITQEQVEFLSFYLLDRLLDGFRNRHCKPMSQKNERQGFANTALVIHEQNALSYRAHLITAFCGGFLALASKCATLSMIRMLDLQRGQFCRATKPSSIGGIQNNLALQYGQVTTLGSGLLTECVINKRTEG